MSVPFTPSPGALMLRHRLVLSVALPLACAVVWVAERLPPNAVERARDNRRAERMTRLAL
jgi:hypothetical protein